MSENYRETHFVSWDQLQRDSKQLAWRLLDISFFKGIIAVTRGGMVPAAIIARELDIHLIDTICVSSYDWKDKKGESEVIKGFDGDGEGWLLVDDLVDTGRTAKIVKDLIPKAHFATIYAKPAGRPLVDSFVTEVSQDTWILFPWDTESQFVKPIAGRDKV
ncbi:MAG: xanthine phosphoribosyltransferase [Desulfotalea sp.]